MYAVKSIETYDFFKKLTLIPSEKEKKRNVWVGLKAKGGTKQSLDYLR